VLLVLHVWRCQDAYAQDAIAEQGTSTPITISLPENVELRILVEYVSQQLKLNILYDQSLGSQKLTVRVPAGIERAALRGLLESALRMRQLALVQTEQPGILKIVPVTNFAQLSDKQAEDVDAAREPLTIVTQVIRLTTADAARVEQMLRPFLTQPGGNMLSLPDQKLLIVTDYAGNLQRLTKLVSLADQPGPPVRDEGCRDFVPVQEGVRLVLRRGATCLTL
jgi:general secretion pathway protein D